jgi:hypothetical protein
MASMTPQEKEELRTQLAEHTARFKSTFRRWSIVYHTFLYGAFVASSAAAIVLQLNTLKESTYRDDLGSVQTAIAAALSGLVAVGAFQRKYRASTSALRDCEKLRIKFSYPDIEGDYIRRSLEEILDAHSAEFTAIKGDS